MRSQSLIFLGMVGLAGCASIPLPREVATVTLVAVSSPAIEVHRPRFLMKKGYLELEAYVLRQWKAETTADSHVDLVFTDAVGRELFVDTANFHPRSLPKTIRLPHPHAYLRVPITNVPPGTAVIEVRGHDGPHETRSSSPKP